MAKRFTIELIMDLASRIGANPAKAISRSNVSFLGKGPNKNPLFQERLAGLENATEANLGKPETLFGAIEDAVGWAKDGKLNSIQTEILGYNLSGINKILNPPVLPSASVTPIASGIEGLRRFPKESHKFFGRPLKTKDFAEIDRLTMEGKIPDARGRQWNLKAPETGTFQGWTPSVVPKANIPASKINHQMIADKYGIDVELIRGKDWVEVLEVIRKLGYAEGGLAEILQAPKMKHGGRIGFFKGALADTEKGIAMSPGTTASGGHRTGGDGQGITDQANLLPSPIVETGEADQMNFDKYISPSFDMKYGNRKMNLLARIHNQNILESDDLNLEGNLSGTFGPVDYNTQFTDQGFGNTNLNYGNFSANIDPNKNYNLGYNTNIDGWDTGVRYDSDGNLMATIGTKFNKGGLAGLLEV